LEELTALKNENLSLKSKLKEKKGGPADPAPTSREERLVSCENHRCILPK
jgi:hypothetical protein